MASFFWPRRTLKIPESDVAPELSPQGNFRSSVVSFIIHSGAIRLHRQQVNEDLLRRVVLNLTNQPLFPDTYSFAPIRTKPKRTYDKFLEDYRPEGDHIPSLLARILNKDEPSPTNEKVRDALSRFGKESGLFKQLEVKKLGKGPVDPFQLQSGTGGPKVNLVDVGYGISQSLPVIVQSVLRKQTGLLSRSTTK